MPLSQEMIDQFVGAAHSDLDRVKELLAEEPELLNANATWTETAIGAAAHTARRDIAEFLLAAGAPLDICTAAMLGLHQKVEDMICEDTSLSEATGAHGFPLMFYPAITG